MQSVGAVVGEVAEVRPPKARAQSMVPELAPAPSVSPGTHRLSLAPTTHLAPTDEEPPTLALSDTGPPSDYNKSPPKLQQSSSITSQYYTSFFLLR